MSELLKKIAGLKATSKRVREQVQEYGIEAAEELMANPAATLALIRLVDAVGAGGNRKSLLVWLEENLPLSRKEAKAGTKDFFTINGKNYVFGLKGKEGERAFNVQAMRDVQWYEAARETVPEDYDVEKAIAAILKRAEKVQEDGKVKVLHPEKLEALKALVPLAA
jgi:hypothetical protein